MNFIVTLCFALLVAESYANTVPKKHNVIDYAPDCLKETGADINIVSKLETGDFSNRDSKTQCFANCVMKASGFFDKKGKFLDNVAKEKLSVGQDKQKIGRIVDSCKHLKGSNRCETSFKLYECYVNGKLAH